MAPTQISDRGERSRFQLADLFEQTAAALPDRLALVAGSHRATYAELAGRVRQLASHLAESGIGAGDHVAIMSWNRHEWLETMLACYSVSATPVNINHRYTADEVRHLVTDSESVAVVCEAEFLDLINGVIAEVDGVRHLVVIRGGADSPDLPAGAVDYDTAVAEAPETLPEEVVERRSSDDLYLLYTGGTTGSPKGVMWRHEDIFKAALHHGDALEHPTEVLETFYPEPAPWLVTSPLMHGNGQWNSLSPLIAGNGVVMWTEHRFDPIGVAELVERERPMLLVLIGDGMGRPFAEAVTAARAEPGGSDRFDLSSILAIASGGALLSPAVKQQLTDLMPAAMVIDGFGASETGSNGRLLGAGEAGGPPRFEMSEHTTVVDDNLMACTAGDGVTGRLARRGHIPLGYWNDPEKTERTFPTGPDGTRWAIPGDAARIEADGTIAVFGRGSNCINTGGEKVHPEEIEAALKAHPEVADAFVVGVADERFGQTVAAVVAPRPGQAPTLTDLQDVLRETLAGYKLPRRLVLTEQLSYTGPGKPDYKWARAQLERGLE